MKQEFVAEIKGRDKVSLVVEQGKSTWKSVGCLSLLKRVQAYASQLGPQIQAWPLPEGSDHCSMLLREVVLKAQGCWEYPVEGEELCHCRQIATAIVDRAIVAGALSAQKVSQQTSAGTACGTCRFQTEKLIAFRLRAESDSSEQAA